jgi:hypothetical protein
MKTHNYTEISKALVKAIFALGALGALGIVASVAPAIAGQGNIDNPSIVPPQSSFRGHTYSEWSAGFFQWVYSLQNAHNPLADTADCSAGQTGNVWFIDGTAKGAPFPAEGRNCTIPPGTALFLPVKASVDDNEACNGSVIQKTNKSIDFMRNEVEGWLLGNYGVRKVIIDGVEVNGLPQACDVSSPSTCLSPYRFQTPVFDYTVPALDNALLGNGVCYDNPNGNGTPYTATGAVGDGFYMMIKPLSVGKHNIQFGPLGSDGKPTRTDHITVGTGSNEKHGFK